MKGIERDFPDVMACPENCECLKNEDIIVVPGKGDKWECWTCHFKDCYGDTCKVCGRHKSYRG